jgi:hypothetical protein
MSNVDAAAALKKQLVGGGDEEKEEPATSSKAKEGPGIYLLRHIVSNPSN